MQVCLLVLLLVISLVKTDLSRLTWAWGFPFRCCGFSVAMVQQGHTHRLETTAAGKNTLVTAMFAVEDGYSSITIGQILRCIVAIGQVHMNNRICPACTKGVMALPYSWQYMGRSIPGLTNTCAIRRIIPPRNNKFLLNGVNCLLLSAFNVACLALFY